MNKANDVKAINLTAILRSIYKNQPITKSRIADELKLTEAQKSAFEPVYRKYRSEIQRVTTRDAHVRKENISNDNALSVLSARLSNQINTASVKQRYLHVFSTVIEPMQIMNLYRIDERISREARKVVKYNEKK